MLAAKINLTAQVHVQAVTHAEFSIITASHPLVYRSCRPICTSCSTTSDSNQSTCPRQHSCRCTKPDAAAEKSIFPNSHQLLLGLSHKTKKCSCLVRLVVFSEEMAKSQMENKVNLLGVIFSPSFVHLDFTRNRSSFRCFFHVWFMT